MASARLQQVAEQLGGLGAGPKDAVRAVAQERKAWTYGEHEEAMQKYIKGNLTAGKWPRGDF